MTALHIRLTKRRFPAWMVLPHLVYVAIAWATNAPALIAVLNSIEYRGERRGARRYMPSALDAVFCRRLVLLRRLEATSRKAFSCDILPRCPRGYWALFSRANDYKRL